MVFGAEIIWLEGNGNRTQIRIYFCTMEMFIDYSFIGKQAKNEGSIEWTSFMFLVISRLVRETRQIAAATFANFIKSRRYAGYYTKYA